MSQHPTGYWGMWCFNALSAAQQRQVVVDGYLPFGWRPEGFGCDRGAEVSIETMFDTMPGPRFYCRRCAIEYLTTVAECETIEG